jgi:hypothetical protein
VKVTETAVAVAPGVVNVRVSVEVNADAWASVIVSNV